MYREVTCWNTGNSYLVTDNANIPVGVHFYTKDEDGYVSPINHKREYIIRKAAAKPSVYKRGFLQCYRDEYRYAFTERTSRVITTDKDVYYNADKDRFISKSKTSYKTKVEYNLPSLIAW
jgi:hypothetical protein